MLAFPKFLEPNWCFTLKIGYEVRVPDVCEWLSTNMGNLLHYMHYAVSYGDSTVCAVWYHLYRLYCCAVDHLYRLYCMCSIISLIQTTVCAVDHLYRLYCMCSISLIQTLLYMQYDITYTDSTVQGMFKKQVNFCYKHFTTHFTTFKHCPLKVVPSTDDRPFTTFLLLLECFLECTFCDGMQFYYHIFLNLLYGLETTSFQVVLSVGNRKKSAGAKSGE